MIEKDGAAFGECYDLPRRMGLGAWWESRWEGGGRAVGKPAGKRRAGGGEAGGKWGGGAPGRQEGRRWHRRSESGAKVAEMGEEGLMGGG